MGAPGAHERHEAEGDFTVSRGEPGYLESKGLGWNFLEMGGIRALIFASPQGVSNDA
jgi:hypothetical protein